VAAGCVEFVAVVPHRDTHGRNYSFPIMESGNVGDSGESFIEVTFKALSFINLITLIYWCPCATTHQGYVRQLRQRDKAQWPHIIWCQSPWCPTTLQQHQIEIPVITTLH
jgi:hypothetical protein